MKLNNKDLNTLGIILGFAGYLTYVLLDTIIKKYLVFSYSVFEINFFISFFTLIPIILTIFFLKNWHVLFNNKIHIQLLRGCLGLLCGALIINSFKLHTFSEIYPILFSAPLILTIFSYFILKEKVGIRRWIAVLIGFIGVLIVSRPGTIHFTWSLFGLFIAAIILATNIVIIRSLAKSQSAIAFSFYGSIAGLVLSSIVTARNFIIPTKDVATMQTPAKVAYVIPTGRYFIVWDNRYMHNIIVIALKIEGNNLVKPFALLANELEAVPNTTASTNIKYGKIFLNNFNRALLKVCKD